MSRFVFIYPTSIPAKMADFMHYAHLQTLQSHKGAIPDSLVSRLLHPHHRLSQCTHITFRHIRRCASSPTISYQHKHHTISFTPSFFLRNALFRTLDELSKRSYRRFFMFPKESHTALANLYRQNPHIPWHLYPKIHPNGIFPVCRQHHIPSCLLQILSAFCAPKTM